MTLAILEALENIRGISAELDALGYPRPALTSTPLEGPDILDQVESKTGIAVPRELRALLENTGMVFVRMNTDGFALTLHGRPTCPQPFGGLADVLQGSWFWDDYRDEDDFPSASIRTLNTEFICFGHCECNENAWDHFFYDRHGRFGLLHFDQDFRRADAWQHLLGLSTGENPQPPLSLEELLVPRLVAARAAVAELLQHWKKFQDLED